ncbi:MAG: F0F1 ATP synthase subunit A [Lachnospiraceae bacterium]|nr:F0F1 ATP synthase subunit A [Lachnospiraceae bacterium]
MEFILAGIGTGVTTIGRTYLPAADEQEVDFFIHKLVKMPFQLFGQDVYLTTTNVCTLIVMTAILIFAICAHRKLKKAEDVPGTFQNIIEILVEALDNLVDGSMGEHKKKYVNYMGTILLFIFLANTSGLFGLRPPTADYGTTFCLAIITLTMIQYQNIKCNKFKAFTSLFEPLPILFPSNLIGEFSCLISLSLRLFGNIMAGTVMLALFYGLLPTVVTIAIPSALHIYLDLFSGAIQAYVFTMLTMTFISQKMEG